ncbi:kinase-like protein [Nadsonia fulvescens var. elongata DSM 6958]|uniref:mitogen-activated protein kinase kinase n=1 Tax=Nadsonia fulvescens var. elongata DSM 6958 TaxID=857566 RepID=A0A1E3PSE1_9ASCO|nr:kinase-like protein [Nadsonia fulvescens var. elongata DSM 6958]
MSNHHRLFLSEPDRSASANQTQIHFGDPPGQQEDPMAAILQAKSLKRRNFKKLSLGISPEPSSDLTGSKNSAPLLKLPPAKMLLNLNENCNDNDPILSQNTSLTEASHASSLLLTRASTRATRLTIDFGLANNNDPSSKLDNNVLINTKAARNDKNSNNNCIRNTNTDMVASQLASLDLGVKFKIDLHAEDLRQLSELGSGNGGMVSKVEHIPTKTIMAKKVIHIEAKPAVRKQIVRELHIMQGCDSPYIVSFYGAFVNEGDVVMCMEYMDCKSLDGIYKSFGALEEPILGQITYSVLEGLTYLYNEHRIIHRDVKPSNILVNSKGEIKLCDFGVSGELINSIADTFVGTSTYMSPERIQGAAYSVKSDVWSLGITLLELALGRFPFSSNQNSNNNPMGILDLLQRIVNERPPSLPEDSKFSVLFRSIIDQCLYTEDERPTPQSLLENEYIRSVQNNRVDTKSWAMKLIQ